MDIKNISVSSFPDGTAENSSAPSSTHFLRLNEYCLLHIFGILPLEDLLRSEIVCRRWREIHLKVCESKKSLKLFRSVNHSHLYGRTSDQPIFRELRNACSHFAPTNDCLIVSKLPMRTCEMLVKKFPAIKSLFIMDCFVVTEHLAYLLTNWSTVLECLSLYIYCSLDWSRLWLCFDSLTALKHLSLFNLPNQEPNPSLNIIGQLEMLTFGQYYGAFYAPWLSKLDAAKLHSLALFDMRCTTEEFFEKFIREKPELEQTLKRLSINMDKLTYEGVHQTLVSFIGNHFNTLVSLDLVINESVTFKSLITAVANLPQLSSLILQSKEYCSIFKGSPDSLPQITSVKNLTLHLDLEPKSIDHLNRVFVNLQECTLNSGRFCCTCGTFKEDFPRRIERYEHHEILRYLLFNCTKCFGLLIEGIADGIGNTLEKLTFIGKCFKNSQLKLLESMADGLRELDFTECARYSPEVLLEVAFKIAKIKAKLAEAVGSKTLTVKISCPKWKKLKSEGKLALDLLPVNLRVIDWSDYKTIRDYDEKDFEDYDRINERLEHLDKDRSVGELASEGSEEDQSENDSSNEGDENNDDQSWDSSSWGSGSSYEIPEELIWVAGQSDEDEELDD